MVSRSRAMRSELNARIGRTMPSPMFGILVDASPRAQHLPRFADILRRHRAAWLLGALAIALWPHWAYVARRMVDGSDEPWGVLALATVALLVFRDRTQIAEPPRGALVASVALALLAAVASLTLPDLAAAAVAMLALGVALIHALRRPAAALIALLLLSLPIIASLQFYLGFPLRVVTAWGAAHLLALFGLDVSSAGAALQWNGTTVLIDAPCAGIGMLWVGSYTAAVLSYLNRATASRTLLNASGAALLVLVANIVRNTALFFPEARIVHWPAVSHDLIGLLAFATAVAPIVILTSWKRR